VSAWRGADGPGAGPGGGAAPAGRVSVKGGLPASGSDCLIPSCEVNGVLSEGRVNFGGILAFSWNAMKLTAYAMVHRLQFCGFSL